MKLRKFLDRHVSAIISIITLIAMVIAIGALHLDAARNIDDQIKDLYAKDMLVQEDFSNAYKLSGVSLQTNENNNVILFIAEDCTLKVTYSKSGELLEKEYEDLRPGKNVLVAVFIVAALAFAACISSAFILCGLDCILEKREKKLEAKKQKKIQEERDKDAR